MSGKIKPFPFEACYLPIDSDRDATDKIRPFLSKLFKDLHSVDTLEALTACTVAKNDASETASIALILDLRGDDQAFDAFVSEYTEAHRALDARVVLTLCEQDRSDKIVRLATEGSVPSHILIIPWKQGVLERVIEDMRAHAALRSAASAVPLRQLNKGGNREYIEKLNAANSFYAGHAHAMHAASDRLLRLVKNIAQDDTAKDLPFLGRLIQYSEVVNQGIEELAEFSGQNWHTYHHQTPFDINTVLDTVSSTAIPFLSEQGFELIFEVANNVPARLKGYPVGMTHVIVTVLELIADAKVRGELIMRVTLQGQDKEDTAILNVQFMQSHYRGSVTNVILSTIQKDRRFSTMLNEMDEIEGSVLHADSEHRGDILQLGFRVEMIDRRSYRLPSKTIMDKAILIIDDRKKNAEVLQKMLQYFHLFTSVSAQLDEAIMHLQDHEYDVVIVTDKLARRCAKSCKQAQQHEKFIIINTDKRSQAYLGLDLADSFLNEPYTHKGIFNAIVDIFSDESVEERMKDVATLKSYLGLLSKNRRIVYIGNSGMAVRSMQTFLEGTGLNLEVVQNFENALVRSGEYDFVLQSIDAEMLRSDMTTLQAILESGRSLSRDGRVVCVVPEELQATELDRIAPLRFVITYIQEPIDPEVFYKILLDWAMGIQ